MITKGKCFNLLSNSISINLVRKCMWIFVLKGLITCNRVQRKPFLQLAIWASWSYHLLDQTSFQLAPKAFWQAELISQFFCHSSSSKNISWLLGKLKTEFTSLIAKSTSPGLSATAFFARCVRTFINLCLVKLSIQPFIFQLFAVLLAAKTGVSDA